MRPIEFRAWDKENKCLTEVMTITWRNNDIECVHYSKGGGVYLHDKNQFVLMQYTGLKDKNGKEIYEGDYCEDTGGYVSFCNECCGYQFFFEHEGKYICHSCDGNFSINDVRDSINIIGNIYETPNLIK